MPGRVTGRHWADDIGQYPRKLCDAVIRRKAKPDSRERPTTYFPAGLAAFTIVSQFFWIAIASLVRPLAFCS